MAIQINRLPLPSETVKAIQEWLSLPGCRAYQEHVANCAAALAAEGANLHLEITHDDPQDEAIQAQKSDADEKLRAARGMAQTNKVMDTIRAEGYTFVNSELKSQHVTHYGSDDQPGETSVSLRGPPGASSPTV